MKHRKVFGMVVVILMLSLVVYEVSNFPTTAFALNDLLGDLKFIGFRWVDILAVAFLSVDLAALARLATARQDTNEPSEIYLVGAWFLAISLNALLVYWAVYISLISQAPSDSAVWLAAATAFIAWLGRLLIIGSFWYAPTFFGNQVKSDRQ